MLLLIVNFNRRRKQLPWDWCIPIRSVLRSLTLKLQWFVTTSTFSLNSQIVDISQRKNDFCKQLTNDTQLKMYLYSFFQGGSSQQTNWQMWLYFPFLAWCCNRYSKAIMFKCCFIVITLFHDLWKIEEMQFWNKTNAKERMLIEISLWYPQNAMTITSNIFTVYNILAIYCFYSSQSVSEIMS